jgi:benzoylformate decarboxylase
MGELTRNQPQVRETLELYDLLFMAGGDGLRMSLPSPVELMPPSLSIIQCGTRDWELGKNYPAEIALDADVKETLKALLPILEKKRSPEHAARAGERAEEVRRKNWSARRESLLDQTRKKASGKPIEPDFLMMQIAREIPEETIVVEEGISSTRNLLSLLAVKDRHRFFGLASGGIGCGIAAAVGIKLALPDRPMVAVIGDGSAMYSIQALWSAANQKRQILFILLNNGGYTILKERLKAYGGSAARSGRRIGMDFSSPGIRFSQLADSLGVPAVNVTDPEAVGPAIREALGEHGPILLDVRVRDTSEG